MKKLLNCLTATIAIFAAATLFADTLELADGTILEGDFVGSSNGIIMFNTGEGIEAFPEDEVVGLFFSSGVAAAEASMIADSGAPATITVPAGTRLVIRTTETVDTRQHSAGHRFRGQLEGAIVVDGITVAPRGTFIHGQLTSAQQAGRAVGRSEMSMTFTDIMLDDQLIPIATGDLRSQGASEAGRTVGRTARAAAIGGLIDGSSGARTGARVGAGASILTRGSSINVLRGTILETELRTPLVVPQ